MIATHDPRPIVEIIAAPLATAQSATFTRISWRRGSAALDGFTLGRLTGDERFAHAARPRRTGNVWARATFRPSPAQGSRPARGRRGNAETSSLAWFDRSRSTHSDRR